MIGKVLRGTNAARLLYYLYGPGKGHESDMACALSRTGSGRSKGVKGRGTRYQPATVKIRMCVLV